SQDACGTARSASACTASHNRDTAAWPYNPPPGVIMLEHLVREARDASPDEFMALLREIADLDEQAQEAARQARRRLNAVVTIGLERRDINNREMARTTGIKERDLYKRKDRVG